METRKHIDARALVYVSTFIAFQISSFMLFLPLL